MRSPLRRNKKIGLTQGGRIWNGKPSEKWSRLFPISTWEKLSFETEGLQVIRENPSKNYFYPCSKKQVLAVLEKLPKELTSNIRVIIFKRISKTDEKYLIDARRYHQCIILNAFPNNLKSTWNYKPTQSVVNHMKPWCNRWIEENGKWTLQWNHSEIRRYYLYHVLLHEIGHINDCIHNKRDKREGFAENFALEWARRLEEL